MTTIKYTVMPDSAHADTGNQYDALPDEMEEARANTLKKGMLPFSKHHVRWKFRLFSRWFVNYFCCFVIENKVFFINEI